MGAVSKGQQPCPFCGRPFPLIPPPPSPLFEEKALKVHFISAEHVLETTLWAAELAEVWGQRLSRRVWVWWEVTLRRLLGSIARSGVLLCFALAMWPPKVFRSCLELGGNLSPRHERSVIIKYKVPVILNINFCKVLSFDHGKDCYKCAMSDIRLNHSFVIRAYLFCLL